MGKVPESYERGDPCKSGDWVGRVVVGRGRGLWFTSNRLADGSRMGNVSESYERRDTCKSGDWVGRVVVGRVGACDSLVTRLDKMEAEWECFRELWKRRHMQVRGLGGEGGGREGRGLWFTSINRLDKMEAEWECFRELWKKRAMQVRDLIWEWQGFL